MRLGIDGWRLHGARTGVGRYLANILRHWTPETMGGRFDQVRLYTPHGVDTAQTPLPMGIHERVVSSDWPMLVWENLRMAPIVADDVLFCPSYTRPLLTRGKTVVTTHDATIHLFPELYPQAGRGFYDHLYGWSARHATLVITTTEVVRQQVSECYHVPLSRIRVVPLAADEIFRPRPGDPEVNAVRLRYLNSDAPFFLFVGKLSTRRNVPKLMEAFAEFRRSTSSPHKLLVVGLNSRQLDLTALAAALDIAEHVVHIERVSDEDLSLLYNAADVFIMPSTFETLSLPVMEAQATGTPVITIDTPGLRETTGGAALLMPKAEVPIMVESMARLTRDSTLRRDLSERGIEHARTLSWRRCSIETLAVLEEAAATHAPRGYPAGPISSTCSQESESP